MKKLIYTFLMGCLLGLPMGLFGVYLKPKAGFFEELITAIEARDATQVTQLLDGRKPFEDVLVYAVEHESNAIIDAIIKWLALRDDFDPNVIFKNGCTLLGLAAVNNKEGAVKLLLEKGANPIVHTGSGMHVLHVAAECESNAVIEYLAKRNDFDLDVTNKNGWTPLGIAASENKEEAVKLLLKEGAKPIVHPESGAYVLHAAAKFGSNEVIKYLASRDDFNLLVGDGLGATPLDQPILQTRTTASVGVTKELLRGLQNMKDKCCDLLKNDILHSYLLKMMCSPHFKADQFDGKCMNLMNCTFGSIANDLPRNVYSYLDPQAIGAVRLTCKAGIRKVFADADERCALVGEKR